VSKLMRCPVQRARRVGCKVGPTVSAPLLGALSLVSKVECEWEMLQETQAPPQEGASRRELGHVLCDSGKMTPALCRSMVVRGKSGR
jgi:hypothetical protein